VPTQLAHFNLSRGATTLSITTFNEYAECLYAEYQYFCINVTFEMRTILYRICLFIDTDKIVGQHFISNGNGGEESKIEQIDRERECVRDCVWGGGKTRLRQS
jgi:hypothetical protein